MPDKIILTREGATGSLSEMTVGKNVSRILVIYGLLSMAMLYIAYRSYVDGNPGAAIFFGAAGLYLVYGILKSRNHSATPVIDRAQIVGVTYNRGVPGLTRPYFDVEFNDNGKLRKRAILLPGTLGGGHAEAEKALLIMKEENLLN